MSLLDLVFVVLILLWVTGRFMVPTGGDLVHVLLVVAVIVLAVRLLQGRKQV